MTIRELGGICDNRVSILVKSEDNMNPWVVIYDGHVDDLIKNQNYKELLNAEIAEIQVDTDAIAEDPVFGSILKIRAISETGEKHLEDITLTVKDLFNIFPSTTYSFFAYNGYGWTNVTGDYISQKKSCVNLMDMDIYRISIDTVRASQCADYNPSQGNLCIYFQKCDEDL